MAKRMRSTATAALLMSVSAVMVRPAWAATCAVATDTVVVNSNAYTACRQTTGIDFAAKKASAISQAAFCGSDDCYALWQQVEARDALSCFQKYDQPQAKLSDTAYAAQCFTTYGVLTPAPSTPSPTTAAPTKKPTPTNNAGANGATASAAAGVNANENASSKADTDSDAGVVTVKPSSTKTATSDSTKNAAGSVDSADDALADDGGDETTSGSRTTASKKRSSRINGTASSMDGEDEEVEDGAASGSGPGGSMVKKESTSLNTSTTTGSQGASGGAAPSSGDANKAGNGPSAALVASGGSSGSVVVIIVVFLYFRKRNTTVVDAKKLEGDTNDYLPTLDSSRSRSDSISVLGASGISGRSLPSSRFAFWDDEAINAVRIPYEKLTVGTRVSRGGYGEVYRGTYRHQPVAIKSLLAERRKDMRQIEKFLAEVKLMAALEHEHIVRFVGVAWDSLNELCVVSEYMEKGDLRSLLAKYEMNEGVYPQGFTPAKTKIALHVAHALTYMHSLQPNVLHRDLKSRNILLDKDLNAKVTDFGISRERADSTMTVGVGSSLWMAPEVMTGGRYDEKADVFSLGVVLSELDTQTLPYAHALEPGTNRKLPDTVIVQMMTTGRVTVEFSDETAPLAQIGRACVALEPAARPTAAEVQHFIHQLWSTNRTA